MAARRSYGTGSLWQRKDAAGRLTWYGRVWVNGKQSKRALGPVREAGKRNGLTKPQAEEVLRKKRDELATTRPVTEVLDIAELGRRKIRAMQIAGNKPASINHVRSGLDMWLVPHFGATPIDRITSADIDDLMAKMRTGDRPPDALGRAGRPLSPKSIRNYIGGVLSPMLKLAAKRHWLSSNPMDDVVMPTVRSTGDIRFLTVEEVAAVVRAALAAAGPYSEVDAAIFEVAAKTGLRQGELLGLRRRDVDWSARRLRVVMSWSTVLKRMQTTKTDGSDRSVPIMDDVVVTIDRYLISKDGHGDDLVFADPVAGGPLNANDLRRRFKTALAAAAVDESHRFHDLRHTFGTRMAAAGAPIRSLQAWMGHTQITTTQRYADYAPAPEHEIKLMNLAWRPAAIEAPTSEVDAAAVAAWLREHQPDMYATALEELAVTT